MIAKILPTTLQEFFDNAWQHAIVEGNPYCGTAASCWYRQPHTGNACLIGCSIPDVMYRKNMETKAANHVLGSVIKDAGLLQDLNALQNIHDNWGGRIGDYPAYIFTALTNFAVARGLKVPS